jgi:predicted nucleic acid-binding protein
VKLLIDEPGSEIAAGLWSAPVTATSSVLSYPEGRAALAAARRAGRLGAAAHRRARGEFEALQSEMMLLGIDGQLAHEAGELAENLGLRGYDAVHLASALALGSDTTFVTWDEDLRRAAARSGCAVAQAL